MGRLFRELVFVALGLGSVAHTIDESKFKPEDIITRDVAIIGGGATGTYAAVRLKDQGKMVALIEREDHLGGHVNTYTDPATNTPVDYGVLGYLDLSYNKEFFERFNVSIENATNSPWQDIYADFSTGKLVPDYPSVEKQAALETSLATYVQIAAQYNDYIFPGLSKLAAGPVPDDLSMPFGDFIQKYNLSAILPLAWIFSQGLGDILNKPTVFVMLDFGVAQIEAFSEGTMFVPSSHNNSQLYGAALEYLAEETLLSSKVSLSTRDENGVKLVVKGPTGTKLVKAKKLLITMPPTKQNMYPFDFDKTESEIFSKWVYSNCYVGLFTGSGLPDGLTIMNTSPNSSTYHLPTGEVSFVFQYTYTGIPGLYRFEVVTDPSVGAQSAKDMVRDGLRKLGAAGTYATKRIDFVAFAAHNPLEVRVSQDDLVNGFYGSLYGLQGKRSTWYTGQPWAADYSSILWLFTEENILPDLLAG